MAETIILGLRLTQGIDRADFTKRFGRDPTSAFPKSFARYAELGALTITPSHVRLAEESLFVADTVLAEVLAEA